MTINFIERIRSRFARIIRTQLSWYELWNGTYCVLVNQWFNFSARSLARTLTLSINCFCYVLPTMIRRGVCVCVWIVCFGTSPSILFIVNTIINCFYPSHRVYPVPLNMRLRLFIFGHTKWILILSCDGVCWQFQMISALDSSSREHNQAKVVCFFRFVCDGIWPDCVVVLDTANGK